MGAALTCCVLLTGCLNTSDGTPASSGDGSSHQPETPSNPTEETDTAAAPQPEAVSIPAIDVSGELTYTGSGDNNVLEVPEYGDISWFSEGVTPGDVGPAALLGHVDSSAGPDVFFRLDELGTGDEVVVERSGADPLTFVIDDVEQHAKESFPTEKVWMLTPDPQLRLITCGGEFDEAENSYHDNVIAFASLRE